MTLIARLKNAYLAFHGKLSVAKTNNLCAALEKARADLANAKIELRDLGNIVGERNLEIARLKIALEHALITWKHTRHS